MGNSVEQTLQTLIILEKCHTATGIRVPGWICRPIGILDHTIVDIHCEVDFFQEISSEVGTGSGRRERPDEAVDSGGGVQKGRVVSVTHTVLLVI